MVNYQNAKIYVLKRTKDDKTFYVGSTVNPLSKRLSAHKTALTNKQKKHWPVYRYIIKKGGKDAFYIELYKRYPCDSKEELTKMEGRVIRRLTGEGIRLKNQKVAGRTAREYAQTDKYKANRKVFEQTDKRKEYKKIYKQKVVVCECGQQISKANMSYHKKSAIHQRLIAEQDE